MTPISHSVVKVKMKIVDKREGLARFLRGKDPIDPRLTAASRTFSNRKFKTFAYGQTVIATFRISESGRRYLLNVRAEVDEGVSATPTYEPVEPKKPPKRLTTDGYYYPPDVKRVFTVADEMAKKIGVVTLLMVGPSGYGKTTLPQRFAKKTGRHHVRVNCAAIRDPEEWFGFREAEKGSTVFDPSEFARCISQGNSVIVLDEVNRLEPWLHNTLFPLLDDDRGTEVHNRRFEVADDTIFVMTLNQGVEFTGTFELDQAFLNRVHMTIHVGAPPEQAEIEILVQRTGITKADAKAIVEIASKLRAIIEKGDADVDCSTRASIRIAQLLKFGTPIRVGFHDVVEAASGDLETRKRMTDAINMELGTFGGTVKAEKSVFDA